MFQMLPRSVDTQHLKSGPFQMLSPRAFQMFAPQPAPQHLKLRPLQMFAAQGAPKHVFQGHFKCLPQGIFKTFDIEAIPNVVFSCFSNVCPGACTPILCFRSHFKCLPCGYVATHTLTFETEAIPNVVISFIPNVCPGARNLTFSISNV